MNQHNANIHALEKYAKVNIQAEVETANPWRLVQMLMEGALTKIAMARVHIRKKEFAEKGECIGRAISIIGGLRDSLDHDIGGDLSKNLDIMYEYMTYRLMEGNKHNNDDMLNEVGALLAEIKLAWDEIGKDQTAISAAYTEYKQQQAG